MADQKKSNRSQRETGNQNEELPGYPHYPSDEDITNPQHGFRKISADEELANSGRLSSQNIRGKNSEDVFDNETESEDDLQIVSGTDADVTQEDLLILGDRDADQDLGDDEQIGSSRVDDIESESDLDIPGAQMNDDEALGQEDEENNYYSLGGDRHENLEEDPPGDKE
jgi:hypothetical protein